MPRFARPALPAHLRVLTGEQRLGVAIALRSVFPGCRRDSSGAVETTSGTTVAEFEQCERKLSEALTCRAVEVDGHQVFVGFWQVDGEAIARTTTRSRRFATLDAAAKWYRSASDVPVVL